VEIISEILARFKECETSSDGIKFLVDTKSQNPDIAYIDRDGSYIYKNYIIKPSYTPKSSEYLINTKTTLEFLNKTGHCKTSAPKLIGIEETKDQKFSIIVLEIQDTKDANLVPYEDKEDSTEEKINQFIEEQKKLLEENSSYNPIIFNNLSQLYLTPDTKTIIISVWDRLETCQEQEKFNILTRIENLL
jgi:hypothetical protein